MNRRVAATKSRYTRVASPESEGDMSGMYSHLNVPVAVSADPQVSSGILCSARHTSMPTQTTTLDMSGAGTQTWLHSGHCPSILYDCTLSGVRMRLKAVAGLTSIEVIVCRYAGTTPGDKTYTKIAKSALNEALATGLNDYTLTTPIACQAGDKIGLIVVASGANETIYSRELSAESYNVEVHASEFSGTGAFDQATQTLCIDLMGLSHSPIVACIGDSTTSGQIDNVGAFYSFLNYNPSGSWEASDGRKTLHYPGLLQARLPTTLAAGVANFGFAGQTLAQVASTYMGTGSWIVDARPNVALISSGINEATSGVALGTYLDTCEDVAQKMAGVGSVPVFVSALPSGYLGGLQGAPAYQRSWRGYRRALWALCKDKGYAYIDLVGAMSDPDDETALNAYVRGTLFATWGYCHPSLLGYNAMASLIARHLVSMQ